MGYQISISDEIINRFRIEPRAAYTHSSDTWLVVFDKQTGEYIKEPGRRKFMKFRSSDQIYLELEQIITQELKKGEK